MITINGTLYRLCLLDTNAISEMAKRPAGALHNFLDWSLGTSPTLVPCFTPFTLLELRKSPSAYAAFTSYFDKLPCLMLKGHEQLLEDEVSAYPDPSGIDPSLLAFAGPLGRDGTRLRDVLHLAFKDPTNLANERIWVDGRQNVVEGMLSLVSNWPPDGANYRPDEARDFVWLAGMTQLVLRASGFAARMEREVVDIDAFPSLKATLFTVFHKFYVDRTRKASRSDAFDIVISAATPYVDAVITEAHQAECLRKTKSLDPFIDHVDVLTLRDLRAQAA